MKKIRTKDVIISNIINYLEDNFKDNIISVFGIGSYFDKALPSDWNITDIDVIVMGALGKSEQDRMVHGSTVANVSKFAHCHVIAIRNPAKQFTLPGSMY